MLTDGDNKNISHNKKDRLVLIESGGPHPPPYPLPKTTPEQQCLCSANYFVFFTSVAESIDYKNHIKHRLN